MLNNVGEPYDGRQIASLIRLVDLLLEKFDLPRPQRDPTTGLYVRNRTDINTGGERVITHFDFNGKCDPIGSMRSSGVYFPVDSTQGCAMPSVPIPQGDADARESNENTPLCLGDLFGVQDRASPDHAMNAPYMPDIALRIGIQDQ